MRVQLGATPKSKKQKSVEVLQLGDCAVVRTAMALYVISALKREPKQRISTVL
ncbi:hypothetical protein D3C80_2081930 [compost metagenome]|jgi:hypothetical protein